MSGFQTALSYVFADGGPTVPQHLWEEWRDRLGKPGEPPRACTREDAEMIYHLGFWSAAHCDGLFWPASLCVFDAAVQHDPAHAVKMLQRVLGVEDDGIPGPRTLAAAEKAHPARLVRALIFARLAFYRAELQRHPDQRVFGPVWISRVLNLRARCVRDYPEAA